MANNYDDIVKKNKDYLTQAQINALASASQEYNIANAGKRAGALQNAREQYDASYRGLQNMGLAGNQNAAPTSGEVPRLQMKIKTPFDSYNDRLKQVEHQRLGILGEQFKQQTIAQREAEAAARRAQEALAEDFRQACDDIHAAHAALNQFTPASASDPSFMEVLTKLSRAQDRADALLAALNREV